MTRKMEGGEVKHMVRILLVLLSFSLLCLPASADILPQNSHYVERCVKIANLDQYPSIVVITQDLRMSGDGQTLSPAAAGACLPAPSYKFDGYKIYWAERSYADSISLQDLKLKNASYEASSIDDANIHFITSSISTAGGYIDNSNPATSEEVSYILQVDSAGGYSLVSAQEASQKNNTAPSPNPNGTAPSPVKPSTPSKPAPFAPPPSADGSSSMLYMGLVLVLGAAAIFILFKAMPPAHSVPPAQHGQSEVYSKPPTAAKPPAQSKPAARKKKG